MKVLVSDAGPIIQLFEVQRLDLLFNMGSIYISNTVKFEVEPYLQKVPNSMHIVELESEDLFESERIMKGAKLHRGEAESIVLAKKFKLI